MLSALPPGTVPGRSPGARRGHRGHRSGRFTTPQRSAIPSRLCKPNPRGYDQPHERAVRADDPGAPLDSARRPAGRAACSIWMLAGILGHVALPLPRRRRDRVPAQPARTRPAAVAAAARGSPWRSSSSSSPPRSPFVVLALGSVVVDQTRSATDRIDDYVTVEDAAGHRGGAGYRPAPALARHPRPRAHPDREQATDWADNLGAGEISKYTQDALSFAQGAAFSIVRDALQHRPDRRHRDLHAPRHGAARAPRRPPLSSGNRASRSTLRIEKALAGYVRGQLILSTVIGLSAGIGMWVLGRTGLCRGRQVRASCSVSGPP